MKIISINQELFKNKQTPTERASYNTHRYDTNYIMVRNENIIMYARRCMFSDSSNETLQGLGFDRDDELMKLNAFQWSPLGLFYSVSTYKHTRPQGVITKVNLNDLKTKQVRGEKCYVLEELEKEFVYVKADFIEVLKDTDLYFFTVRFGKDYLLLGSFDKEGELIEVAITLAYAPYVSIEDVKEAIYSKDYDELSDYLKGVRDLLNATTDSGEDEDSIFKYILAKIENC